MLSLLKSRSRVSEEHQIRRKVDFIRTSLTRTADINRIQVEAFGITCKSMYPAISNCTLDFARIYFMTLLSKSPLEKRSLSTLFTQQPRFLKSNLS